MRRRGEDRGSVTVEFVLVLPVLLIILFSLIDFGRLMHAKLQLAEAAREGARAARDALTWEASARMHVDLYSELLGRPRPAVREPARG